MAPKNPDDAADLLRLFTALTNRYMDQELMVEFENNGHFSSVSEETCDALKLPIGETVGNYTLTTEGPADNTTTYMHIANWPNGFYRFRPGQSSTRRSEPSSRKASRQRHLANGTQAGAAC